MGKHTRGVAPLWLVEGTAAYVSTVAASKRNLISFSQTRRNAIADAKGASVTKELRSLDARLSTNFANIDNADYTLGFLATELLVRDYGEDAVRRDFWQAMATKDYRGAFHQTFQMSLDDFYAQFEAYRGTL